jgi:hypothetical protein
VPSSDEGFGGASAIGRGRGKAYWRDASPSRRCPVCHGKSWCAIHRTDPVVLCHREANENERVNAKGERYWKWVLGSSADWKPEALGPDPSLAPRAADDVLDMVYRDLLAQFPLSREHRAQVRARGLTDEHLEAMALGSLPAASRQGVAQGLYERYGDAIRGVPGVFVGQAHGRTWWSIAGRAGLLIPTFSLEGRVISVRIRDESGYKYLSSSGKGGAKAVQAIYCPPWCQPGELVRVTEGEFKAAVASVRDGIPTLGLPGHGQYSLALEALRAWKPARVLITFDRDPSERTRHLVEHSRASLAQAVEDPDVEVGFETWPLEAGKGIDDVPLEAVRQVWDTPCREPEAFTARDVYSPVEGMPEPLPPEQGARRVREFLLNTWAGVYLIHAETGLGKTRAAADVAMARARTPYKHPGAKGARAPAHSKTALVLPSHAIAQQLIAYLESKGFREYFYLRGSTAVERSPGEPECTYHVAANALARGKQRIKMVLCDGCERSGHCPAEDASRGPPSARVIVTVHSLLDAAVAAVGTTGMVILDESMPPLEQFAWERPALRLAIAELPSFVQSYADGMAPALHALEDLLARATESTAPQDLTSVLGDLCNDVYRAREDRRLGPPLTRMAIQKARGSRRLAERIGEASAVLDAIERAVVARFKADIRIEVRSDHAPLMRLTMPNVPLMHALRNAPTLALLDAFGDTHLPILEGYLQVGPSRPDLKAQGRYLRVSCADGAPIQRTLVRSTSATRTNWLPAGQPLQPKRWRGALHAFAAWVREHKLKSVGLITYQPIAQWLDAGGIHELELAGVDVKVGYYGNTRGSDAWKHCDGLATLGDARPNVGEVLEAARFTQLADPQRYLLAQAADEHGQSHGRIRAPHRTAPGWLFHYGAIPPAGYGWQWYRELEARSLGRPKASRAVDGPQLRAARIRSGISQRELGVQLSIHPANLASMESGRRPVTAEVAAWVKRTS